LRRALEEMELQGARQTNNDWGPLELIGAEETDFGVRKGRPRKRLEGLFRKEKPPLHLEGVRTNSTSW